MAREVVADAQRVAQACPAFELYPGLTAGIQVTATGFAGPGSDESVLFEYSTTGVKDQSTLVALIRVGDLIIFLYVPPHLWQTSIAQEAVQAICRAGPEC